MHHHRGAFAPRKSMLLTAHLVVGEGELKAAGWFRLKGERLRILRIAEGIPTHGPFTIYFFVRPMQLPARPSFGHRPNSARAGGVSVFSRSRFSANPSRRTPHGEEPCSLPGSVDSGGSKHPQ
jgi:hypothetical protein